MRERHEDAIWCVTQMNRVIQRGLTYQKACNLATLMQEGSDRHRAGSRTPQADFNVAKDMRAMQDQEVLRRQSTTTVSIGV